MESSNQVASLYRQLQSKGYNVFVSHPKKTGYNAEAKIKSDRVDSKVIAELTRLDALPLDYLSEKKIARQYLPPSWPPFIALSSLDQPATKSKFNRINLF